jgi:hypothetical protein
MQQATVKVRLDNIYKVAKRKKRVSDVDFQKEIAAFWAAIKGIRPENIVLAYNDEKDNEVQMTLKEAGETDQLKTVRAVGVVGGCILNSRNDPDCEALRKLSCLGHYPPTELLANRGNIFTVNSKDNMRINCEASWMLIDELLK